MAGILIVDQIQNSSNTNQLTFDNSGNFTTGNLICTGTITGGTGLLNIGSGQIYKDTSGNVGLGVTPSGTSVAWKQIALWNASIQGRLSDGSCIVGANVDSGANKYLTSNPATYYYQVSGTHQWFTAASGTAGNAISFTQAMTLDTSGNLGIGTSSPGQKLSIAAPSTAQAIGIWNRTLDNTYGGIYFKTSDGATDQCSILNEKAGTNGANLLFYTKPDGGSTAERARIDSSGNFGIVGGAKLLFGGTTTTTNHFIKYNSSADGLQLDSYGATIFTNGSSNTERARIDSSGNFLVGATSTVAALYQTKSIQLSCGSPTNRMTDCIVQQSYGSSAGLPSVILNTVGPFIGFGVDSSASDNTIRFATVAYDSNGIYWGSVYCPIKGGAYTNASDYRIKENVADYVAGALSKVLSLRPVTFNVIPEGNAENAVVKTEVGFIAHEIQEHIPEVVYGEKDAVNEDGTPHHQAVDYAKLTAVLTKAIQELSAKNKELEDRLAKLENK